MMEPSMGISPVGRLRTDKATALIEDIKHSAPLYPEYDARLLAILSDLKDRFKSCAHADLTDISFDDVRDLLQEADTMRQDNNTSSWLVQLAVLSFDNGALLLEKVLGLQYENVARRLVSEHLAFVAKEELVWLEDLQLMGVSAADMVNKARIAFLTPWLTVDDTYPEGDDPGALDTELHQPDCVHTGGSALDPLQNLGARTKVDRQQLALDHGQLRKRIAAYCGLGGVFPDWKSGTVYSGVVTFDRTKTSVYVYFSKDASEYWVREQEDAVSFSTRELLRVRLYRSQRDIVTRLETATRKYCQAATVIQNSKCCCNSFTLVMSRKPTEQLSAIVDMVSISFRSLKAFRVSLQALRTYEFVHFKDIQNCSAIAERLLGTFGYTITCSKSERGLVQLSSVDCQLHVISLATQLLGFGLVSYMQGHLGPLSTFFLAEPLTEVLLLGIGNDSLYIKASLKDLACLGEMIGGPVFAFELMSPNKLSPDVFELNPTNRTSPQNFKTEPTSSVQSKSQPSPGQACELLARGVDIGDTWGPALFISERGSAYGKRLYAIEIGGGVLKAVEPESREVSISSPTPFIPKAGLAYVKRIHDIAIEVSRSRIRPFASQSKQDYSGLVETGVLVSYGEQHYMEPIEIDDGLETSLSESEGQVNNLGMADFRGDDNEVIDSNSQESSSSRKEQDSRGAKTRGDRSTEGHLSMPVFHWSPQYGSYKEMKTQPTFSCWDWLQIGAISTNSKCPLQPIKTREQSQQRLSNLGTEPDFWELSERQVALQAGYYTLLQIGNTYARKLGRTIKQQIIEEWSMLPNIRSLNTLWGLQVSLCTGIAKRVSLLNLIQDSLLEHIEPLDHEKWHKMLPKVKAAFKGSINIDQWINGLDAKEKDCLIATLTYVLALLRRTGLNHGGTSLSVLWPHPSNISYGIRIPCDKRTFWARMMQDTDSCATFAAVTSSCFEGHNHRCRNMKAPPWLEDTVFLSTAVCRSITATSLTPKTPEPWRLEDGKRYWIGKAGGDCWVLVRRNNKGESELSATSNRFPKVISHSLWKLDVLRERPDTSFIAEEVIVF